MVRFGTFFKVMALVAIMFGVSYNADAQILGKIANAVKGKTSKNAADEKPASETTKTIDRSMPKPDAKASPTTFSVGKNGEMAVCTWNPATLEITMLTEMAGNKKGDVIKLDPSTGKFTNNRGEDKGSISEDGTIVSPHLGILKFSEIYKGVTGVAPAFKKVYEYLVLYKGNKVGNLSADGVAQIAMNGRYDGDPSRLLVAYVYYGLLLDKRTYSIMIEGFDPELKYTVDQLYDKVKWMDQESINKIMKYESSLPGAGFRDTHPEFKNCKVAAVGLMDNQWYEKTGTDNNGYKEWFYLMEYWVIYELADGRNVVTFSIARENSRYGDVISKWQKRSGEFHEVSDWVRK